MTETDSRPFVRVPGEDLTLDAPVGAVTYRARGEETGGALTAIQTVAAPGEGPPLHLHAADDEFIYVLEGRLRIRVDEDVHGAPTGSFVFIPKNVPHTWQAAGEGNARFLFGFAPASPGMERFFERSADLSADTRLADGFGRFAGDAGMEVLGPPLAQSDPKR